MAKAIDIVVGFDEKEAIAYHAFCDSVIEHSTAPIRFTPLSLGCLSGYVESHTDGSNAFIYSRFLTPWIMNYSGWAIFADGDMLCLSDINQLWALRDESKAVMVCKHNYKTKQSQKYLGNKNQDYPRKNWSSLILWNCAHSANRLITPSVVGSQTGAFLHRFSWLNDSLIGELPLEWNWLVTEYEDNYQANLLHYTLGTPCFKEYQHSNMSDLWHRRFESVCRGVGK